MKQLLGLMLLIIPFSGKSQNDSIKFGIQWEQDLSWDQIKEKAKRQNKFIFVDAYATWCVPCKKMDKQVYSDIKVGEFVNSQFISVKIQMDETARDNDKVKAWYPVVQTIKKHYNIEGYPTFLFFAPDSKLVLKGVGFQGIDQFVSLAKEALTDPIAKYENAVKKFKNGQLDYLAMPSLAREASSKKDGELAVAIAKEFKEKYVDGLNNKDAFTKVNLSVLAQYSYYLLNSGDRYFQFFYKNVGQADSIIAGIMIGKHQKVVKNAILRVIRREEIADKIYKDGKPITRPKPNWNAIYNSIKNKYGQDYINLFFPDTEISFYILAEDWGKVTKLVNKKILKIPPKINGKLFGPQFGDAWTLNNYAWTLFLKCKDKKNLKQGVGWADLAISVENNNQLKSDYLDTKANLLYKMGKIENAIKLQEAAVSMVANETNSFSYKSKSETLTKMKSGLVTWPEK